MTTATPARLLEIAEHLEEQVRLLSPVHAQLAVIPHHLRELAEAWAKEQRQVSMPPGYHAYVLYEPGGKP